jgi:peptidoglycan/xylan/chitin deacetylase (PgdA/CDA1 family)
MKKLSLILITIYLSIPSLLLANNKQFPIDGLIYSPSSKIHKGWSQYLAKSLYGGHQLVLTFDDGPHYKNTTSILDTLKTYQVKATFFVLGSEIKASNSSIIQRIVNEGHILASHDWTHSNNNSQLESNFKSDLNKSIKQLYSINSKQESAFYRFPYGAYAGRKDYHHMNALKDVSKTLFNENCINFVFWDIDTADWVSDMRPEDIKQNIVANVFGGTAFRHKKFGSTYKKEAFNISNPIGGGIVLMHDIHSRTAKALPLILEWAQNEGVEIIPLTQVGGFNYDKKVCELI